MNSISQQRLEVLQKAVSLLKRDTSFDTFVEADEEKIALFIKFPTLGNQEIYYLLMESNEAGAGMSLLNEGEYLKVKQGENPPVFKKFNPFSLARELGEKVVGNDFFEDL